MTRKPDKVAFGRVQGDGRVILSPVRKARPMVPVPVATYASKAEAEQAAAAESYRVEWLTAE